MEIYNDNYCVYAHINKINGKMYVGQTGKLPEKRWDNGNGYKKCPYFWRAIQKHGWDNFYHEVIASHLTKEEADNFEILLINKLSLRDKEYGYNLKEGGSYGSIPEETKQKIREANTGKFHSDETRKRMSNIKIGNKNSFYGKHHSNTSKQKIKEANSGKNNHNSKPVYQYDLQGNFLKEWDNMTRIAETYGVGRTTVMRYCRNQNVFMNQFIFKLEKT